MLWFNICQWWIKLTPFLQTQICQHPALFLLSWTVQSLLYYGQSIHQSHISPLHNTHSYISFWMFVVLANIFHCGAIDVTHKGRRHNQYSNYKTYGYRSWASYSHDTSFKSLEFRPTLAGFPVCFSHKIPGYLQVLSRSKRSFILQVIGADNFGTKRQTPKVFRNTPKKISI